MHINIMKKIGITGGVGCGKSTVLELIKENCNCHVVLADDVANMLKDPGQPLYDPIIKLLGDEILTAGYGSQIDRAKMAAAIFGPGKEENLKAVNQLIHPAVREYIEKDMARWEENKACDIYFLEAALLIEERYDEILDEIWYIYSSVPTRTKRLKEGRAYSDERIAGIMSKQMTETAFFAACQRVVDNDGSLDNTSRSVRETLAQVME